MGCANANQMNCVLTASQERREVKLKVSCLNSANIIAIVNINNSCKTFVRRLNNHLALTHN